MRWIVLALVAPAALLAAPAVSVAAAPCTGADRAAAMVDERDRSRSTVTRVVLCDAAGRARVLRSARRRGDGRNTRGRLLTSAVLAGRRVVWGEIHSGARSIRFTVIEADRRGRVLRRRSVARLRAPVYEPSSDDLPLGRLRDGTIVWAAPVARQGRQVATRIVTLRPGGAPRRRLRTAYVEDLTVEDGRTVSWISGEERRREHLDLLPIPLQDGCPRRPGFRRVSETATHRVTERTTGDDDLEVRIQRVCLRGEARDAAVGYSEFVFPGEATTDTIVALLGRWAIVATGSSGRDDCCDGATVRTVDLRGGRTARRAFLAAAEQAPVAADPQVVAGTGAAAWLKRTADADLLLATRRGASSGVVLERSAPGAIGDLAAGEDAFTWTSGGARRTAPAP